MNYGTIKTEVELLVQDPSDDIALRIPSAINEALVEVAGEVLLPSLKSLTTADTVVGQAYCNMPSTFNGGKLLVVTDNDSSVITIAPSLSDLLQASPDLASEGDVVEVALEGRVLWYRDIPATATSLLILMYRDITELTDDTDENLDIPRHLHRKLLIHGAMKILYSYIEDGIDEGEDRISRPNTSWHNVEFEDGLTKLRTWVSKHRLNKMRTGIFNV